MVLPVLLFASANRHKADEVAQILQGRYTIQTLSDVGIVDDIPETQLTFEGNALQKAMLVHARTGQNCFADDSGLEIDALQGAPGIYSARFAGPQRNAKDNIAKVLQDLGDTPQRTARFRCVIILILDRQRHVFEGRVEGKIAFAPQGEDGFGYDPIFIPDGYSTSFAEMSAEQKNKMSHRGLALEKMLVALSQQR